MEKDFKKELLEKNEELKELLETSKESDEFRGFCPPPVYNDNNDVWLFGLLLLLMLDKDDFSPKQPSINIYIGGDK